MQDFEIPRYRAAVKAFSRAFDEGYAEGKRQLADGKAQTMPDVPEVFPIGVPWTKVLDDVWQPYVLDFREAGLHAALAARRTGEAQLDASDARQDSRAATHNKVFRWRVVLNP